MSTGYDHHCHQNLVGEVDHEFSRREVKSSLKIGANRIRVVLIIVHDCNVLELKENNDQSSKRPVLSYFFKTWKQDSGRSGPLLVKDPLELGGPNSTGPLGSCST